MQDAVIFADDLTGACDAGVTFSSRGLPTRVLLPGVTIDSVARPPAAGRAAPSGPTVRAHTLESRDLGPSSAAAAQRAACRAELARLATAPPPALVYKKVDSTIRGNLGPEIVELMESFGSRLAVLAPAMPSAGRTTVGGYQLLAGVPVDRTTMGKDPGAPVRSAYIPARFASRAGVAIERVGLDVDAAGAIRAAASRAMAGGDRIVLVVDAVSDDDLAVVARATADVLASTGSVATMPRVLAAGSAAFAFHLCTVLFPSGATPAAVATPAIRPRTPGAPVVVVSGTRQPVTQAQLKVSAWIRACSVWPPARF